MRPETIFFIGIAALCLGLSNGASDDDRPAARLCAGALLFNTLASNAAWYQGIISGGGDAAAVSMIVIIFALFRYQRSWTLPVAILAVTSLLVRGIFDSIAPGARWYQIFSVNVLFVLQVFIVALAAISGGRRGELDVGDIGARRDSCVHGDDRRSED